MIHFKTERLDWPSCDLVVEFEDVQLVQGVWACDFRAGFEVIQNTPVLVRFDVKSMLGGWMRVQPADPQHGRLWLMLWEYAVDGPGRKRVDDRVAEMRADALEFADAAE